MILQPNADFDQSAVDFGQVTIGFQQTRELTLINLGEGHLNGELILDQDSSAFSILSPDSIALDPLETTMVELKFSPSSESIYIATISFVSNDPDEPQIFISLSGSGSDALVPGISLSSSALNFGDLIIGTSKIDSFTITSSGTDTLRLDSISTGDGAFTVDLATPVSLAPGVTQAIKVTFQPLTAGTYSSQMDLHTNSSTSPAIVSLDGSAADAVSYSTAVQPVFDANCTGCHGNGGSAGLNLNSYSNLMIGSNSGEVVIPGDGTNSLIIKKLRGTAGSLMPRGGPALPESTIDLIETWIDQGAINN